MNSKIKIGKYKHYKGHICTVIGIALHSEDQTELVIYTHPHRGHEQLWARPLGMFLEEVEVEGHKIPRFEYIGE